MFRTRAAGVVAALVAAAVLVPAGTASAQTETLEDASGDVWQNFYDAPSGETSYEAVESPPNSDITRLTVTHDRKHLTVKAKYVDLVEDDRYETGIQAFIRLDDGNGARLTFKGNDWDNPYVGLWMFQLTTPEITAHQVRCRKMAMDVDFKRNTMTAVVPTTCLGNPRWVQVHGLAASASDEETAGYQDSPHTDGYQDYRLMVTNSCFAECEGWTRKLTRTR